MICYVSRWWRAADDYLGQTVLVVGSRASVRPICLVSPSDLHSPCSFPRSSVFQGGDICRDLALLNLATPADSPKSKIYQSTRSPIDEVYPDGSAPWTKEVIVIPRIERIDTEGTIIFSDGTELDSSKIDSIIFATGYNFYFPFCHPTDAPWSTQPVTRPRMFHPGSGEDVLPPADRIEADAYQGGSGQVDQLDEGCQMFYLPDPTIAFVGLGQSHPFTSLAARTRSLA